MSDYIQRLAIPGVRFNLKADVRKIPAQGEAWKTDDRPRVVDKIYPIDHPFSCDQVALDDAKLAADLLAFSVNGELTGHVAACNFERDRDIGCERCTLKDMNAKPALPSQRFSPNCSWIIDTGSGSDLFTKKGGVVDRSTFVMYEYHDVGSRN